MFQIAIIGAACRFPGAETLEDYWALLADGRSAISEIPDNRWAKDFYFHPAKGQAGKSYTWSAGVLSDLEGFDASYFGISPREARQVDPQQRLLLELTAEAINDSGLTASRLAGTNTGVYIGVAGSDYASRRMSDPASADAYFMTGTTNSIVANRVSYIFDLKGPSFAIDTACSSALVAVHQACEALRRGEIETAIVGGVNLLLSPYPFIGFCQASMLSPTGQCYAFDARADGYVRSEGAGVIILTSLKRANTNRIRTHAIIHGSGVNSDGRTMGLSLPSGTAQSALLKQIYAKSRISPAGLSFLEAHGTGTPAGDPIELTAIGRSLCQDRTSPLLVGSAKSNIGHLETASGMAGLLKAMLALERRALPKSINFDIPNPNIPLATLGLEVATRLTPLDPTKELFAGVNSFGFGGTNAHVILGSAPSSKLPSEEEVSGQLAPLLLSAQSEASLRTLAKNWVALAEADAIDCKKLIRGQARHRDHHRHRLFLAATERPALINGLKHYIDKSASSDLVLGQATNGKIAFVYSGNGSQFTGMARDALEYNATFRNTLRRLDRILKPQLGWSIVSKLRTAKAEELARTDYAQPLLFVVQVAITNTLEELGVTPDITFGHSVGEIAAAWKAGAISLATACHILAVRSKHQHLTQGQGGMAAISVPQDAKETFHLRGMDVEIAAYNSRTNFTVAGTRLALSSLQAQARDNGWRYTHLDLDYAFHSSTLEGVRESLISELATIDNRRGDKLLISTVTGLPIDGILLDANYWWRNVREPVHFQQAVAEAAKQGATIFIEIGPNPILLSYLRDGLKAADLGGRVLPTLTKTPGLGDPFPTIAGACYVAGVDLSRHSAYDGASEIALLPEYPWDRGKYWFPRTSEATSGVSPATTHPLLGFACEGPTVWTRTLDLSLEPWISDHAIEGVAVFPAAAFIELALAAAWHKQGSLGLRLTELEILQSLTLEEPLSKELRVTLHEDAVQIESRNRLSDASSWVTHARANLAPDSSSTTRRKIDDRPVEQTIDATAVYGRAKELGLNYGEVFQSVKHVKCFTENDAQTELTPSKGFEGYFMPPPSIDGILQSFLALLTNDPSRPGRTLLPWRFADIKVFPPYGRVPVKGDLEVTYRGVRSARGNFCLFDENDLAVAEVSECWFKEVALSREADLKDLTFHFKAVGTNPLALQSRATPVAKTRRQLAETQKQAERGESSLLLEACICAAAYREFAFLVSPGQEFQIEDLYKSGISNEALTYSVWLLDLLVKIGAAKSNETGYCLQGESSLPNAEVIWRDLLARNSALTGELALLAQQIQNLNSYLTDARTQENPTVQIEHLLYASPTAFAARDVIVSRLREIIEGWPDKKTLRVLELGGHSGALTRAIIRALSDWNGDLQYFVSESSTERVGKLEQKLSGLDFVQVLQLDPDQHGIKAIDAVFDVVISAGAATLASGDVLSLINELLADDGELIAVEPGPNALWDFIFGREEAWWRGLAYFPISSIRSTEKWLNDLSHMAFSDVYVSSTPGVSWPIVQVSARRTPRDIKPLHLPSRKVVIVTDNLLSLTPDVIKALADFSVSAEIIEAPSSSDDERFVASLTGCGDVHEIIVLPTSNLAPTVELATTRILRIRDIANLVSKSFEKARLRLVTIDAQQDEPSEISADAAVWGFARVISNEFPNLQCRVLDLHGKLEPTKAAISVATEVVSESEESEVVIGKTGERLVLRLLRGMGKRSQVASSVQLVSKIAGKLDGLAWEPQDTLVPGDDEIVISTAAADINFRDVMWALGLLPEEALMDGYSGPHMGLACAGIVKAVGKSVSEFNLGDRVLAIASATLATEVKVGVNTAIHIPQALSFFEATTLPVAFMTVLYSLGFLAQIKPGEIILIHGAAGGVGQAAIQYARAKGCTVIATAGSPLKCAFLKSQGVDYLLDSRSLSFSDDVKEITRDKGVDVVLNSLNGQAMELSLSLLQPFGRFIELGKRDFYEGTRVDLRNFRRNISYFAVDIDALPKERPALCKALMSELMEMVAAGVLRPLPHRVFAKQDVVEALRLMQSSGHVGKIILALENDAPQESISINSGFKIEPEATYVISGGLTGFGLETARWLAKNGARHLALLSRRGSTEVATDEVLAELNSQGIEARPFRCDVADPHMLSAALNVIRAEMPSIKGVVHAAMVLDDALLPNLTATALQNVLRPKLAGAIALDELTRKDDLDFFLLYSSATTALGAPGQGSYVAANSSLESVARWRRYHGLPASVVAWGPIGDAGILAHNTERLSSLTRRLAVKPMRAQEALDALPKLISSNAICVNFASVQWGDVQGLLPVLSSPTFAAVTGDLGHHSDFELRDRLKNSPLEERKALLLGVITEEVSRILSSGKDTIDPNRAVAELGMDSLMAVEMRLALERKIGVTLPMFSLSPQTSLSMIATRLAREIVSSSSVAGDLRAIAERFETSDTENVVSLTEANGVEK